MSGFYFRNPFEIKHVLLILVMDRSWDASGVDEIGSKKRFLIGCTAILIGAGYPSRGLAAIQIHVTIST